MVKGFHKIGSDKSIYNCSRAVLKTDAAICEDAVTECWNCQKVRENIDDVKTRRMV